MNRLLCLVCLLILISIRLSGQCSNSPTVTLSSTSGKVCNLSPVTISGNTFGGSTKKVTIKENGSGSVTPASVSKTPFSFTYTPKSGDIGKNVEITLTTDNPLGAKCSAAKATYVLTIVANPSAPLIGTITKPTCANPTGSVVLNGLPSGAAWSITQNPGGIIINGAGADATITNLAAGSYTFAITSSEGCISSASGTVVIPSQPGAPAIPAQTAACGAGTGKATVNVTSPTGTGLTFSLDGGLFQSSSSFTGIANGSHSISVKNASGCTSTGANFQIACGCTISPPIQGTLIQPTCFISSGIAQLNGLPPTGLWSLMINPGAIIITGSGISTSIPNLPSGTYTFTVTNSDGCTSVPSANVVILPQPDKPSAPIIGAITPPTCVLPTGSVQLTGLPAAGAWTLTRYPGAVSLTGSGATATLTGISSGIYNFIVTGTGGCTSAMSANAIIPSNQDTPSPPLIGSVVQPHTGQSTGIVILNGLPSAGSWTMLRSPDNVVTSGTGVTNTISGLAPGTYKFRITNSAGCTSVYSDNLVIIPLNGNPLVVVTNPAPVCFPSTVDITDPKITLGSTSNLTFTYWKDADGKIFFSSPSVATAGTWYIRGMASDSAFDIQPVTVTVFHIPVAKAGTDQVLSNQNETTMNAEVIQNYETGVWSEISGTGSFFDSNYAKTAVTGLSPEKNVFAWTVTNGICPPSSDTVVITVHDNLLPTLITPNMDGRNDYFVLKGFSQLSRIELVVFDRRGNQVYKSLNYDNLWNGEDLNGKPLPEDTYFYVVKAENSVSLNGFVVIKR